MEEKILEIIRNHKHLANLPYSYRVVSKDLAKEITSHIMEFVDALKDNFIEDDGWWKLLTKDGVMNFDTEEVYQYWFNNVKK